MTLRKISIGAGLLSFGLLGSAFCDEVVFQLKFEPGKSYRTVTTMDQTSSMMMAGQTIEGVMKMEMESEQVASATEGGVSIVQGIDSVKLDVNAGVMAMTFDSANPEGPLAAMFEPLMDAKTTMLMANSGEVLKVEAPALPGMENLGMGQEELAQSAREFADMMPNRAIEAGESWKSESRLSMGGMTKEPVVITYTMTFEGMVEQEGKKLAKVDIEGAIQDGDDNIQVTSEELSGTMLFDPALNQMQKVSMLMHLEIGLPEGAAVAEGAAGKMPMKIKTVSRLLGVK